MSHYDILILGAGAAGLGAAQRLKQSGLSFLVLEARARPGGRAWTVPVENAIADLGCGWLHSADQNPLVPHAAAQGLTLDKTPPPWSRPDSQIGPNAPAMVGFGESMANFRDAVEAWRGPDVPTSALIAPNAPFAPLLDAVSTYYSGAELAKVSLHDLQAYADSGVNWRVREGLGALIAGLAQGAPIRYNCAIIKIDHSGQSVRVETREGAITAKAVIVTLPSAVIAQTPDLFRPALPEKTEAAHRLPLGLANKLYMAPARPEDFLVESRAFGRIDRAATAAFHFRPLGAPIIEAYFGGAYAQEIEANPFAYAQEELIALFGANVAKGLRPLAFHGWRADPFARGSYSYATPGHANARATLAAPIANRLYFAGEACSVKSFSTAHGAYLTGLEAAESALRHFPHPPTSS